MSRQAQPQAHPHARSVLQGLWLMDYGWIMIDVQGKLRSDREALKA